MKLNKKSIILLIVLSLFLRIIISEFGYYGDIDNFHLPWARDVLKNGFPGFYERNTLPWSAIYPPLAIILFSISIISYQPIQKILWWINLHVPAFPSKLMFVYDHRNTIATLTKIPGMIADISMAFALYLIAKKIITNKKSKFPLIILLSSLFNPAIIFNSSFWGQIDIIPVTLFVWSIYFLFTNRSLLSSIFFMLGMLSKQTIGVFIFLYIFLFISKTNIKNVGKAVVLNLILMFLVFLPFNNSRNWLTFPSLTYLQIATKFASNSVSAHAFNFWWLTNGFGHVRDTFFVFGSLTAGNLATVFVTINTILVLYFIFKKGINLKSTILAATLISLFMFLFSTRMHERHLLPAIPFLLLATVIDKRFYWVFLYATFFHLLNLYAAWGQPEVQFLIDAGNNKNIVNPLIIFQILVYFVILSYFVFFSTKKSNLSKSKAHLIKH